MKRTAILAILILLVAAMNLWAQSDPFEKVFEAFRNSDAGELAVHFNSTIDLKLPDNENTYSSSQGEMIFKEFFRKYPSKSFSLLEKGSTDPASRFAIGEYSTETKVLKIFIFFKEEKTGFLIHNITVAE